MFLKIKKKKRKTQDAPVTQDEICSVHGEDGESHVRLCPACLAVSSSLGRLIAKMGDGSFLR